MSDTGNNPEKLRAILVPERWWQSVDDALFDRNLFLALLPPEPGDRIESYLVVLEPQDGLPTTRS